MTIRNEDKEPPDKPPEEAYESCPHCGEALSPWQLVLLAVDRALVCKKCWYRIILDAPEEKNEK